MGSIVHQQIEALGVSEMDRTRAIRMFSCAIRKDHRRRSRGRRESPRVPRLSLSLRPGLAPRLGADGELRIKRGDFGLVLVPTNSPNFFASITSAHFPAPSHFGNLIYTTSSASQPTTCVINACSLGRVTAPTPTSTPS